MAEIKTVTCSRCRESVEGQEGRHYLICEDSNNQLFRRGEGILCTPCLGEGGGVEVSEGARRIIEVEREEQERARAEIDEREGGNIRIKEEAPDSSEGEEEGKLAGNGTSPGMDNPKQD